MRVTYHVICRISRPDPLVYEQGRFEVWLGGSNRKIQDEYIKLMSHKNIGKYRLSQVLPGVDSIIETTIIDQPDFDNLEELKMQIEWKTIEFVNNITSIMGE